MAVDANEALLRATLIRSDPSLRGITRENGSDVEGEYDWKYFSSNGEPITEEDIVVRWNSMALPPGWVDVWICPNPRGHIQATGKDTKGRLQYRYHPDWIEITAEMKYDDVVYFASQLPRLRRQVNRDLAEETMSLETVSALVVKLIDLYNIRVGSDEYARMNESYGLTTLKSMHVKHIRGEEAEGKHDVVFTFTGKSNKEWEIKVEDDRLVDLILRTNRLGAKDADLFMYISAAGNEVDLKAEHINQYIRASSGEGFTAKNFRTWAATSRCAARLAFLSKTQTPQAMKKWLKTLPDVESIGNIWSQGEWNVPQSDAQRTKVMLAVIDTVASDLGNTRAVCRSSYIHPWFMDAWMEGTLGDAWESVDSERKIQDLSQEESATLRLLKTI